MKENGQANSLDGLKKPADYQTAHSHVFPSVQALAWFMRRNRNQLVRAGAVLTLNRRLLLDVERFNSVVRKVGAARTRNTFLGANA